MYNLPLNEHAVASSTSSLCLITLIIQDIPDGYRLFGRFVCDRCHNEWGSANSWKGYHQECKRCKEKEKEKEEVSCQVITWDFNFLRKGEGNNKNGHLIDKCGKCKELKIKGIADNCLKRETP